MDLGRVRLQLLRGHQGDELVPVQGQDQRPHGDAGAGRGHEPHPGLPRPLRARAAGQLALLRGLRRRRRHLPLQVQLQDAIGPGQERRQHQGDRVRDGQRHRGAALPRPARHAARVGAAQRADARGGVRAALLRRDAQRRAGPRRRARRRRAPGLQPRLHRRADAGVQQVGAGEHPVHGRGPRHHHLLRRDRRRHLLGQGDQLHDGAALGPQRAAVPRGVEPGGEGSGGGGRGGARGEAGGGGEEEEGHHGVAAEPGEQEGEGPKQAS
mmetsp:Transcript_13404/g.37073  ORF Transcript_13404/g.37073 Transcript_13404/m.37073 type:complete len:268 (+) Transcript_13404:370-1173(+)